MPELLYQCIEVEIKHDVSFEITAIMQVLALLLVASGFYPLFVTANLQPGYALTIQNVCHKAGAVEECKNCVAEAVEGKNSENSAITTVLEKCQDRLHINYYKCRTVSDVVACMKQTYTYMISTANLEARVNNRVKRGRGRSGGSSSRSRSRSSSSGSGSSSSSYKYGKSGSSGSDSSSSGSSSYNYGKSGSSGSYNYEKYTFDYAKYTFKPPSYTFKPPSYHNTPQGGGFQYPTYRTNAPRVINGHNTPQSGGFQDPTYRTNAPIVIGGQNNKKPIPINPKPGLSTPNRGPYGTVGNVGNSGPHGGIGNGQHPRITDKPQNSTNSSQSFYLNSTTPHPTTLLNNRTIVQSNNGSIIKLDTTLQPTPTLQNYKTTTVINHSGSMAMGTRIPPQSHSLSASIDQRPILNSSKSFSTYSGGNSLSTRQQYTTYQTGMSTRDVTIQTYSTKTPHSSYSSETSVHVTMTYSK